MREVRPADAEEEPDGFADLGMQRMQLRDRPDRAIEDKIFRPLVQQFVDAELLAAMMAERRFGVDLALHDIELAIDRRQAALRLDQNHSVHAVGNVMGDHGRRAVIDIESGNQRLERHRFFVAGIDLQCRRTAAGHRGRMKIHRVDHVAVGRVLQMHLDRVADANAQEGSGHFAVEGPVAETWLPPRGRPSCSTVNRSSLTVFGLALAERWRKIGRLARNLGFDQRLCGWQARASPGTGPACQPGDGRERCRNR